jgi:hypothetical protein
MLPQSVSQDEKKFFFHPIFIAFVDELVAGEKKETPVVGEVLNWSEVHVIKVIYRVTVDLINKLECFSH